ARARDRSRDALYGARLLPGRDAGRRPLLAVSSRRRRARGHRPDAVVHPRGGRMSPTDDLAHARYVELQVTTHFSFLRGASSPEELFAAAAVVGLPALAVTDRNTLGGLVRAMDAEKITAVRAIVGCRLDLACGTSLLVYPTDRQAYARL